MNRNDEQGGTNMAETLKAGVISVDGHRCVYTDKFVIVNDSNIILVDDADRFCSRLHVTVPVKFKRSATSWCCQLQANNVINYFIRKNRILDTKFSDNEFILKRVLYWLIAVIFVPFLRKRGK